MNQGLDGIARWKRIADDIRIMIADMSSDSSHNAPVKLAPEAELAKRFGANRHTVRRAIASLSAEGLLSPERGRGTFVRPAAGKLVYPVGAHTRFTENVSQSRRQPSGRLVGAGTEIAEAVLAKALDVSVGAALVRLETLHVADGIPLSVATSWFNEARFPRIVSAYAETGSITKALAAHGVTDYHRRATKVTAERVGAKDATHLSCPTDAIVIVSRSTNYDAAGAPVQISESRFLAERVELVFDAS